MFTVLPYLLATGGSVVDTDMSAVADAVFTTRNSHYIFTEQYNLMAQVAMGATFTRANVQVPTWNAIGRFNVWPGMLSSANILSPPRVAWMDHAVTPIPMNEEYTVKMTDGASENAMYFLWPATPGHTRNIPAGQLAIPVRATSTITQVANGWAGPGTLSMEQSLRGGVYSIVGAECVGAASALFRLIFPRSRNYKGRYLRPGWLCQQAIGDLPEQRLHINPYYLGEWGRFHTFEQPQLEVYGAAATSSVTFELRLWLIYLGQDEATYLDGWVAGMAA
jgi:hypothetical protein